MSKQNKPSFIPELTEIYTGEIQTTESGFADDFPELQQEVVFQQVSNQVAKVLETTANQMQSADSIIAALLPEVRVIIKKAVLQELTAAEKRLSDKLEEEMIKRLRKHLKQNKQA